MITKENYIKDRLLSFLSYLRVGQTKFEENCGLSRGFVNKMTDRVGVDRLLLISRNHPELNLYWLITGEGDMIKNDTVGTDSTYMKELKKRDEQIDKFIEFIQSNFSSKKEDAHPDAKCADVSGSDLVR